MNQFTLDKENKKLLGVCSGLARYFDIDVTLIRVAFLFLFFIAAGTPLLLYIILALVAPDGNELE